MASAAAPSTPDPPSSRVAVQNMRRAFTLPTRLNESSKIPTSPPSNQKEEVTRLFSHANVRVIKFRPLRYASQAQRSGSQPIEPGTLPWASRPETILAYGNLLVYKAPHTVTFLNAGACSIPILPRTQCWCVDGESKFVLPTQDSSYCRLELPTSTEEDTAKIEEFKVVLAAILRYEKTACPFKRGFTVDLPPEPETPVKQVPWKPRVPVINATAAPKPSSREGSPHMKPKTGIFDTATLNTSQPIDLGTVPIEVSPGDSAADDPGLKTLSSQNSPPPKVNQVAQMVDTLEEVIKINEEKPQEERPSQADAELTKPDSQSEEVKPSEPQSLAEEKLELTSEVKEEADQMPDDLEVANAVSEPQLPDTVSNQSPTGDVFESDSSDGYATARSHSSSFSTLDEDLESDATDDTNTTLKGVEDHLKTPTKNRRLFRSATASPAFNLGPIASQKQLQDTAESASTTSSAPEKFHAFHSPVSTLPPSPPDSDHGSPAPEFRNDQIGLTKRVSHRRDNSTITVIADSSALFQQSWPKNGDGTPKLPTSIELSSQAPTSEDDDDSNPGEESALAARRNRRQLRQQRSLSPMPPAANITRPTPKASNRHITASIIQTTWAILNSPPSHLVQLMLTVARRIANGALTGTFISQNVDGESITCAWDYTDQVHTEVVDWEDDDYGVPIRSPSRQAARRRLDRENRVQENEWDVD